MVADEIDSGKEAISAVQLPHSTITASLTPGQNPAVTASYINADRDLDQRDQRFLENLEAEQSFAVSLKPTIYKPAGSVAGACTGQSVQAIAKNLRQSCASAARIYDLDADVAPTTTSQSNSEALVEARPPIITSGDRRQIRREVDLLIQNRNQRGLMITSPPSNTSGLFVEIDSPREQWLRYRWGKLSIPGPMPSVRHYSIPKTTRAEVSEFLTEYCSAEEDTPYALFLVDASGPVFNGAILIVLRTVMDWSNPTLFESCSFEGEVFIVPENHDPWLMIDMLAENDYIQLIEECHAETDAGTWVDALCFDAYIHASNHTAKPTMARLNAPELLWVAWAIHLRPLLREWIPYVEASVINMEYQCVNAFVINGNKVVNRERGACQGLVNFTSRLLATEVECFLEEDEGAVSLKIPECECTAKPRPRGT